MDRLKAALNPCSVETISTPVELANGHEIWPLVLSCYQLDPETSQRHGRAEIHAIVVPDIAGTTENQFPLSFQHGQVFYEGPSGILDGKWKTFEKQRCFCTAQSTGEIRAYEFIVPEKPDEGLALLDSDPLYAIRPAGIAPLPTVDDDAHGTNTLCLSLQWDEAIQNAQKNRIVSTYSNGYVALHDVSCTKEGFHFTLKDYWMAHQTRLGTPAEVWSASFVGDSIVSCGDDGLVKFWDVRCTTRPVQIWRKFDAGATCASQHPRLPHIVACGSYNESIAIFDIRKPLKEVESQDIGAGGGIWRLRWHPIRDDRLLVAAMHGGCRVVQVHEFAHYANSLEAIQPQMSPRKKFVEHERYEDLQRKLLQ